MPAAGRRAARDRHRVIRCGQSRQLRFGSGRTRPVIGQTVRGDPGPLVNREESRLIYIRQSAPGIPVENATFSVPELVDLRSRMKTVTAIGDFSTINFTMIGLGEPRVVRAGLVGGSFFDVMGLRPVRGRLIDATDDVPNAAGVAVLTHRFWTASALFGVVRMPVVLPIAGAATVLVAAAVLASLRPAGRASRVDAMQALRSQ